MKTPLESPARRAALLTLLLLTAALTVLGYRGFQEKLAAFQPLGFEPLARSGQWAVKTVAPAPPGDLRAGDQIVLVDGVEAGRIADVRRLLASSPDSQLVVLRNDHLISVRYTRPGLQIDFAWLALAALGLLYLAVGLYSLWRSTEAFLFYGWCLTSAVLYVFSPVFPVDAIGTWIYLADELARLLLPPLTLHLFLTIPRTRAPRRRFAALLYLPALALGLAQVDLAMFAGRLFVGPPTASLLLWLDRLEMLHLAAFASTAVLVLWRRLRSVADWEQHRQLLWLLVGMAAGYVPFFLLYGLPFLAGIRMAQPVAVLAVLPLASVPLAFGWAVLRYRLWDLGLMVRNGLAHVLTLLAGIGSFALLDLVLRRTVPEHLSFARDVLTFFGGAAIIGIVVPAHRRIRSALERLQHGSSFGPRRDLARLGQDLLRERDLDHLCRALLTELETGLELGRANLLLVQGESLIAVRPEVALPVALPSDALRRAAWSGRFQALTGVSIPGDGATAEQRLFAAGYRYVFPLVVREARVGVVLTGFRRDDQPLDSEDVALVRVLLDQAALAIENAQLLDQVHRQLEQVSTLQRHNEGILESSPAGIAVLDGTTAVTTANLAFAALVGRPREEIVGRPLGELLDLGELPEAGSGPIRVSCVDALGRARDLEISIAALQEPESQNRRVLVLQDVTQRVAMESALKEKDRLASLGVLAAGVAHEVNTPLTGISSYAQILLAETAPDDPRRELLEKVERQTFRASRIVSNLLEFARKPGREREMLDLGALIGETADLLRERMTKKGTRLDWVAPEAPVQVVGSSGELQQVFTNLMLNAVDAMTPRGGALEVTLTAGPEAARVEIRDEGPGIPKEIGDSVFQPFFSTKQGQGGTGLGLSITYSIVEQHGGRIFFENRVPRGCTFIVELPYSPPTPNAAG